MKKTITIKGIHEHEAQSQDHAIRNYIEGQDFERIKKFLDHVKEPVFVNITVHIAKPHPHHICDVRIHAPQLEIIVKKEGPELYKVIDDVFDETVQELIRQKDKRVDANKKGDHHK